MIWWIVLLIAIALGIKLLRIPNWGDLGIGMLMFCGLVFISFLIATIAQSYWCANLNEQLVEIEDNIKILQERYDNQKVFIIAYSSKYPIEKKLFESLNPKILLSLPEIKSDNLLVANIENILNIQDDIYNNKIKHNAVKKKLRVFKNYRWWYFTVISPKI